MRKRGEHKPQGGRAVTTIQNVGNPNTMPLTLALSPSDGEREPQQSGSAVRRGTQRRLVWLLGTALLLAVSAYSLRAPLLTGLATAWVVDEPVTKADAIVVLGGRP